MHHGMYLFVRVRRLFKSDGSVQMILFKRVETAAIPTGESDRPEAQDCSAVQRRLPIRQRDKRRKALHFIAPSARKPCFRALRECQTGIDDFRDAQSQRWPL
ncbi:hypothetical protein CFN58_00775 [Pseudomonas avellanae]|uniref:Uncharacterized protein n=1 Tax=Pseudomonas avellanae TaxID=46257 RepID=A0A261WP32_9PSED|nr:hypothetical protein CFN58_00775 [Pseudomonas avellanae]